MEKTYKVTAEKLINYCADILKGYGVKEENAKIVAKSLVDADLRNVSSHGVIRLSVYLRRIQSGGTKGNPNITIPKETAVSALIDGDNGLGSVVSEKATDLAIEKAEKMGISVVAVRNSAHYGAASYWAMKMAKHGMIGMSCSNVEPYMAVTGGNGRNIGNNPISYVFPTKSYGYISYDIACSKMAGGKALAYAVLGKQLPKDSFLDKDGKPTTDPNAAYSPLPFAGHKGYGLAVVVEMLTSVLAGGAFGKEIGSQYDLIDKPNRISHFFTAFKIDLFQELEDYYKKADGFVEYLRNLPKAENVKQIYYPGELENISKKDKLENGLLFKAGLIDELVDFARKAGIPEDEALSLKANPVDKEVEYH